MERLPWFPTVQNLMKNHGKYTMVYHGKLLMGRLPWFPTVQILMKNHCKYIPWNIIGNFPWEGYHGIPRCKSSRNTRGIYRLTMGYRGILYHGIPMKNIPIQVTTKCRLCSMSLGYVVKWSRVQRSNPCLGHEKVNKVTE